MANIIIQVSKYLIIILMAVYTFSCFSIFTRSYEDEENKVLIRQDVLLFMIQITAFIAMYFATQDLRMMFIYGALAVIVMAVILLYNLIYPNVSRLVVNNMCMLITAGMIMITRLSAQSKSPYGIAIRELVFVVVGIVFGLFVPVLIRKIDGKNLLKKRSHICRNLFIFFILKHTHYVNKLPPREIRFY